MPVSVVWALDFVCQSAIALKWLGDRLTLPLIVEHKELYWNIHFVSLVRLRSFPNLKLPRDFNDRMRWLMLFDQDPKIVQLADKVGVRGYVRERLGEDHLVPIVSWGPVPATVLQGLPSGRFMVKTNHDSGGVEILEGADDAVVSGLVKALAQKLERPYGFGKGEWHYRWIDPLVLVEEFIVQEGAQPDGLQDFKFHCSEGKVKFAQVLSKNNGFDYESVFDHNGRLLKHQLNSKKKRVAQEIAPEVWRELKTTAETLAEGLTYVRVDLYWTGKKVLFGEMTFFPMAGLYRGEGQKHLGALLDFKLTMSTYPVYKTFLPQRVGDTGIEPVTSSV